MSRLPLLLVLLALALVAPAAAQADVRIGISDQKPEMFTDPRFIDLNVYDARLVVSWDAMDHPWQVAEIDAWLQAARDDGVEPLVGFTKSRIRGRKGLLPSTPHYIREFKRFRARYPWVRNFSVWNEPNLQTQPTVHRVRTVVSYYRAFRHACPTCRLLAGELIDMGNMVSWVKRFQHELGGSPQIWGLHNYRDVNRMTASTTAALLKATRAKVWLTETGGIVGRRNKRSRYFEQSAAHAAKATRWLFTRLVPLSRRIQRVYLYNWNAQEKRAKWDSALIDYRGRVRPALRVVRTQIERLR